MFIFYAVVLNRIKIGACIRDQYYNHNFTGGGSRLARECATFVIQYAFGNWCLITLLFEQVKTSVIVVYSSQKKNYYQDIFRCKCKNNASTVKGDYNGT